MQVAYVLYWWLALTAVGFVSFPLTSRVCSSLEDKGYSISKIVGLIFLTFVSWMLSSLHILPFGYANITVSILILVAVSLFVGRKNLKISEWPLKKILVIEAVFTTAFILFLLIRLGKPDIYYSGFWDAPYNHAFIASILRGGYAPPVDPWYAGSSIPYYYGGHYLVALITKLTGVPTAIAFSIAIAMFAALAVCGCYGLGYNITKRKLYGFVAALFVCLAGYTSGFFQLLAYASHHTVLGYAPIGAQNIIDWMQNFDFWTAPWLVKGAMVHYPYFSSITGDMHSYFMSIPFQIAYISLIFAVFQKSRSDKPFSRPDMLLAVITLGMSLGFFFILNTWEYPTYIIFTLLAFLFLKIRLRIKWNLFIPLIIVILSFVLILPYYLSGRMSGFIGIGLLPSGIRTSLAEFLEYCAPFLVVIITMLLVLWKKAFFGGKRAIITAFLFLTPVVLLAVFVHYQILVIVVPVGFLCLYFLYKSRERAERKFVLLLIIMAVALAFFCDFVYIRDALSGDWVRLNTVLKLYHQLWIFLGIAAAYGVYNVLHYLDGKRIFVRIGKVMWIGIVVVLIAVALVHPIASTLSMASGRHDGFGINRGTLDGMAYLREVSEGDYEAIQWINKNIDGSLVILEMPGDVGTYSSRVSAFTGLPTVIGWRSDEILWRASGNDVYGRINDVDLVFNTSDNANALELLKKYNVAYIYIGALERDKYTAMGLQKFDNYTDSYDQIYMNEGVSIYKVEY